MLAQLNRGVVGVALLFATLTAGAQSKLPPETRNAALRY